MNWKVLGLVVAAAAGGGAPALAQTAAPAQATLTLAADPVVTDPAGSFVTVRVTNSGASPVAQVKVGCEFFAGGKSLGSSSTTLYAIVPGVTGTDQVRLILPEAVGQATPSSTVKATSARCAIASGT
ncbi:hypothetical protein [Aquabacter spiritensis]|uniref:Uncharacterized protein n=1 Tax=Aquabacter spiritensis TaxID=933073 RepID=A0A4R3LX40_9HYPH|nr:hypothetical protein [Aquabacter spiritensis]TCT04746.1 hypothetical protein EDC64_106178 [Aquabacter spiritensis]